MGFLLIPPGTSFHGQTGGPQEGGYRGGTENLPAIAAMVAIIAYSIPDAPLLQCKKEINLHHVLMVNLFNKNIATYVIITYLDDGICHG